MKITKQELIEMKACEDGLERFVEETNNTEEPVGVTSLIGGRNTIADLLWLAGKKLHKDKIIRFACDCALINIKLIKPYTDKYDDIVGFLNNPIGYDNACATARAARDAFPAASFADAYYGLTVDAAGGAAYYAASCASMSAICVGWVTRAAVNAAEAGKCEDKVNVLLVELFTGDYHNDAI